MVPVGQVMEIAVDPASLHVQGANDAALEHGLLYMTPSIKMAIRLERVGKFFGGKPMVGVLIHWLIKILFNKLNPFKKL